ncbi:MAG TPA: glycosyltransferase family 4 protein [Polyangia bacterium]|nr:glycosyltransferase family 4 protein [Polyangia bacterium]
MKIGYITDERYPSVHTDTQQVVKTAEALGQEGASVDLIPPRMARHLFKPAAARKEEICRHFNVEGRFEIRDILSWPASDLRIEKFFHGIVAPLRTAFRDYDVVYTRNLLPVSIASLLRQPVLFETYRALPRSDPRAWMVVRRAAAGARFLGVSTHSEYSRRVMVEAGMDPAAVEAIPNGFDPADFEGLPNREEARAAIGADRDAPLAVYTGHIRPDKGIGSLLDLAEDCPECSVLIVGGSPDEVDRVEREAHARSLGNVRLTGHVPVARVPLHLTAADVLLLPPTAGPLLHAGRTVLPMKTFTYLAAGRPILAPDLPDTEGILVDGANGLRVPPDDRAAAAAALRRLVADPVLGSTLGRRAREDSARYTWRGRARALLSFMERRLAAIPG